MGLYLPFAARQFSVFCLLFHFVLILTPLFSLLFKRIIFRPKIQTYPNWTFFFKPRTNYHQTLEELNAEDNHFFLDAYFGANKYVAWRTCLFYIFFLLKYIRAESMIYGHWHESILHELKNHYFTNFDLNEDMIVPMVELWSWEHIPMFIVCRWVFLSLSLCSNKSKTNKLVRKTHLFKVANQLDRRWKQFAEHAEKERETERKKRRKMDTKICHKVPEEF